MSVSSLLCRAIAYDHGDPRRIQHLLKVHAFAALIGEREGLPENEQRVLEAAAVLHDIGIHAAEEKYQSAAGKYQEIEGPAIAEGILREEGGFTDEEIRRIAFLIGHHHTYNNVDGTDYQVLIEADFLVNAYEDDLSPKAVTHFRDRYFRTKAGTEFLNTIYSLTEA